MPSVLSAIMFSPRGGSAAAARALARELPRLGWDLRLLSGSRPDLGPEGDARRYYRDVPLDVVEFELPWASADGADPLKAHRAPLHPSYEDRPGAPDRVFASLDDLELEHHVRAWGAALHSAGARRAGVLHLHHLTPIHEAALRLAPEVPIVAQLHGTELLMLERIREGAPPGWRFAGRWAQRLRAWAERSFALIVAPGAVERAAALLGLPRARFAPIANGIDVERFHEVTISRFEHWRHHLVEEPRGWRPGEGTGSVRYTEAEIEPLRRATVLVYVGRFTEVKRLGLLIRAFADAQARARREAALVLVGGHPGEWEGEHPLDAVRATGARNVYLAGWQPQERLPAFLSASDVIVLPSAREQFGQALVEGMACGLAPIAAASFGASHILEDGQTGWLVPPDDRAALSAAIVEAVDDPAERRRRGDAARRAARERFSSRRMAAEVAAVLEAASAERRWVPSPALARARARRGK